MAETPRSSFIPKQSTTAPSRRAARGKRFNRFTFVGTVLLLASLVAAGGTFFYKDYLNKELLEEKQALTAEGNEFNDADMARVKEFDRKLSAAQYLLDNHIAPSKLFAALELSTNETIQFTQFGLTQLPSQNVTLALSGGTEEFVSVALQELQFSDDPVFEDALFGGFTAEGQTVETTEGDAGERTNLPVGFTVTGDINPDALQYSANDYTVDTREEDTSTTTNDGVDDGTGTSTPSGTDGEGGNTSES